MKYLESNGQFRRGSVPARRGRDDYGAGNSGGQRQLPDAEKIAENSHNFRPLGLGYANLGALLMSMALPYDSDGGRDVAAAITALMCGEAYAQSARIAERMGPFPGYAVNREADAGRNPDAPRGDARDQARPRADRIVYGSAGRVG
jgi:ribonucleotide reductase alpha subunit